MRLRVATLTLALLAAPLAPEAQQTGKIPRIGLMFTPSVSDGAPGVESFRQGLRDLGWIEGQNVALELRSADGRLERFPAMAAELVRLKVDVIAVASGSAALAAKHATTTIPIVMVLVPDPVGQGLVASLARPGGNITGLSLMGVEVSAKQLEILKQAVPGLARVAVLGNPANPSYSLMSREVASAAKLLGVQLQILEARTPDDFEGAFVAMGRGRASALHVLGDGMFFLHRARLAELAARSRLPAIYPLREHVEAGGLMAYAASVRDSYYRAASYVDRLLKGAKPADLPVEQPTKFELVINLRTAKALGLTIPPAVLARADELIQ